MLGINIHNTFLKSIAKLSFFNYLHRTIQNLKVLLLGPYPD
jgi:hypothetical protein